MCLYLPNSWHKNPNKGPKICTPSFLFTLQRDRDNSSASLIHYSHPTSAFSILTVSILSSLLVTMEIYYDPPSDRARLIYYEKPSHFDFNRDGGLLANMARWVFFFAVIGICVILAMVRMSLRRVGDANRRLERRHWGMDRRKLCLGLGDLGGF